MFSGFNKPSTVPAGNLSNAAFVGANTVNGPSPLKVSTKSAAFTAATNVEKSGFPIATSVILFAITACVVSTVIAVESADISVVASSVFFPLQDAEIAAIIAMALIFFTKFIRFVFNYFV